MSNLKDKIQTIRKLVEGEKYLPAVHMQDGGKPPKRGVSSLPGYGEGIDDPTTQALLAIRRNLGEAGRAAVGAKPYDETNPTETYRAMQALFNAPTPAAIIPEAAQAAGKAAGVLSGLGALGVVKPKGGNWLAGSIERGLRPMKQKFAGETIDPANLIPVPNRPPEYPGMMYRSDDGGGIIVNPEQVSRLRALGEINNWIDTKLGKYVKNEMATPEDPVRALAERGVLHRAPYELADPNSAIMNKRLSSGMPVKPMGQSQEAQFWENVTDRAIDPARAADFKYGSLDESILQNNPWLEKVPDEAMVYSAKGLSNDLGFNHLIDELRNATNPDSGLPRSLQLSPDKLQKVTVPQAVELVDKINKWRAEQKVAADLKRSQNAATVEYKAYDTIPGTTEPNQRGLRWVELRTPEITSADQLTPEAKAKYKWYLTTGAGEEAALRQAAKYDESLAESLKYEGEVMGHCVGGYCPDVQEGRSRIYSLRDAKGEPHVTIEVQPYPYAPRWEVVKGYLPQAEEMMRARGITNAREEEISELATQLAKENMPPLIQQIKGKANRAPKDEYLPFVQDFVRSGQWSSVGDLGNTGLIRIDSASDLAKSIKAAGGEPPNFVTQQELTELLRQNADLSSYAAGGAVNMQDNRKVRISDNPDMMLLELMNAPKMQAGGKPPPGIKRATERAKESKGVLPVAGARQARQVIQGYLGMDPSFSVMDPEAQALESAYRGGETASVLGDLFASLTPFATASALSKANQVPGLAQLIAYHGSPHKFKKFDASKIGTGEGAQAYGHGLYFAENPKVAKEYAINLANRDLANQGRLNAHANAKRLATLAGDPKYAADDIRSVLELNPEHEQAGLLKATLEMLESGDYAKPLKTQGSLYTVDIPDEKIAQMLDWDKPLSQQPESVRKAIDEIVLAEDLYKGRYAPRFLNKETTAGEAIEIFNDVLGGPHVTSNYLREAGIPGIQYLDQASRDAKQGTRNFVVFPGEEQNIKMLDINGEPQMAKGGKVRISDNLDTMRLELMRAPRMQVGGALKALKGGKGAASAAKGAALRPGQLGFDLRFDPRVKERQRLLDLSVLTESKPKVEIPKVSLVDYEGRPFVTSMSDRTAGGGMLTEINDIDLKRPVELQGGQDFMFYNPMAWASGKIPAGQILEQARLIKSLTGQDPLYIPWRMAPTGGDFATFTGETMLSFAESALGKADKRNLNKRIKDIIPDWPGIDSPNSFDVYRRAPDAKRKTIKNMLDVEFRDQGGLGIGEARLAVADPRQLQGFDTQIMNIGEIHADRPLIQGTGHYSYPYGVPGGGLGEVDREIGVLQLLPDVVDVRRIANPTSPGQTDIRALQMKPYAGILTDKVLKDLGY